MAPGPVIVGVVAGGRHELTKRVLDVYGSMIADLLLVLLMRMSGDL